MDPAKLSAALEQPKLQKAILGHYHGPYSLGVARGPKSGEFVFQLRVAGDVPNGMPREIDVNGEMIKIRVIGGFETPHALGKKAAR